MQKSNSINFFLSLLNAGLWEKEVRISQYGKVDYCEINSLAEEQSVVGLVSAGVEHLVDSEIPQEVALYYAGRALQIERRNLAMNKFVGELFEKLRKDGVNPLLVKGQGVAQCYERPLWRMSGDVDLLLSHLDYERSKPIMTLLADTEEEEVKYKLHKSYHVKNWEIELHGNMRGSFLKRVDRMIDQVQEHTFKEKVYRVWNNNGYEVLLPSIDNDLIFSFTHILQHFFIEGVGLRQICDWCRLISVYRSEIDVSLLETRLQVAGLMSEWKAFAAFAVDHLGMSADSMILYSSERKWSNKAEGILKFILLTGSFGRKRNINETYKYPVIIRKLISFYRHTCDGVICFKIFPLDSFLIWTRAFINGISAYAIEIFNRYSKCYE